MKIDLEFDHGRFIGYRMQVTVHVTPIDDATGLDPEDATFANGALYDTRILSPVIDHDVIREITLDRFHETVPIACLEQFVIAPDLPPQDRLLLQALERWAIEVGDHEGANRIRMMPAITLQQDQGRFLVALFERLQKPFGLAGLLDEAEYPSYWYMRALRQAGAIPPWPD